MGPRGFFDSASFSPDGSEVVYTQGNAKEDLAIASVADGTTRKLTHDGRSSFPVWGPEKIAFAVPTRRTAQQRRRNHNPRYGGANFHLATIAPDGSGRRRLTHDTLPYHKSSIDHIGLLPTDWSADGTRLLAQHESIQSHPDYESYPVTVDAVTGKQRIVGRTSRYVVGTALSRDGSTILGYTGVPDAFAHVIRGSVGTADYATGGFRVLDRMQAGGARGLKHAGFSDWNR